MLRLVITDSAGERHFVSERTEILVGRRDGADLQLTGERACSRNHCVVRVENGRARVIDLGSVNGTKFRGAKISEAVLAPGQEFTVGGTRVRVADLGGNAPAVIAAGAAPVRSGAHDDFGREVREMISKAPWYLTSLIVHIVVLLVADLLTYHVEPSRQTAHMVAVNEEEEQEPEELSAPALDVDDIDPELDVEEEVIVDEPVSAAVRKNTPRVDEIDYDDIVAPEATGLMSSRRIRLERPLPVSKVKGGDEEINKGDLAGDHGRARDVVERDLGDGLRRARRKLGKSDIVVVQGEFDKIERILQQYDWPFTLIQRKDLLRKRYSSARLLFINCARNPKKDTTTGRKLAGEIKRYLRRGCWVITSDWSVEPYLTGAFDNHVTLVSGVRRQPDMTVSVQPVSSDPLLRGVFPVQGKSLWWLEETSYMVRAKGVHLLIVSEQLRRAYKTNVIAFKFEWGSGKVIHLLGHFYQKDGNRNGLVGMHRLINNVILERVNPTN